MRERGTHVLFDQLRIAPTGRPWSVWVFFAEGSGEFAGWYVNLEEQHVRDDRAVYTSDHVLGPPFCDGWETFRPDPAWPIPPLIE